MVSDLFADSRVKMISSQSFCPRVKVLDPGSSRRSVLILESGVYPGLAGSRREIILDRDRDRVKQLDG